MDLAIITQLLRLLGISNLSVRFDDPKRQIVATFIKDSQMQTELINFTDVENLFTEGPAQAPDSRLLDKPTPAGSR